jgi:hypothetical protein
MFQKIVIEAYPADDSRSVFRLRVDMNIIAEVVTAAQAHYLVGEILDRIRLPTPTATLRRAGVS